MKYIKQILAAGAFLTCIVAAEPSVIKLQKGELKIDLFGTIHIAKPDFYPLPDEVITRLNNADALAVELDVSDKALVKESAKMIGSFKLPKTALDEPRLALLKKIAGGSAEYLKQLKPVMIAVLLDFVRAEELNYTAIGIDAFLIDEARKDKKIISLEKPADQFEVFNKISDEEGLALFDYTIAQDLEHELARVERVWRNGDAEEAKRLRESMQKITPTLTKGMLTDRNKIMAERIDVLNKKHKYLFVAIGALHLYGDDSVLAELQKRGYVRAESKNRPK